MLGIFLVELAEAFTVELGCSLVSRAFAKNGYSDNAYPIQVLSDLPGRIRMRIPGIKDSQCNAERLEHVLEAQPWVEQAKANPVTGTLLVTYDRKAASPKAVAELAHFGLTRTMRSDKARLPTSDVRHSETRPVKSGYFDLVVA